MLERLLSFRKNRKVKIKTLRTASRTTISLQNKHIYKNAPVKNLPTLSPTRLVNSLQLPKRSYAILMQNKQGASLDELRLKELQDCIELYKSFGNYREPQDIRLGILLHELAKQYGKTGNYIKSKETFEKTLTIFEKWKGQAEMDIGIICSNLADAHYHLKNIEESTALYERALTIFEKHYSKSDPSHIHLTAVRQKLVRNKILKEPQKTWGNHPNFYTLQQTNQGVPSPETPPTYLELTPRFCNL